MIPPVSKKIILFCFVSSFLFILGCDDDSRMRSSKPVYPEEGDFYLFPDRLSVDAERDLNCDYEYYEKCSDYIKGFVSDRVTVSTQEILAIGAQFHEEITNKQFSITTHSRGAELRSIVQDMKPFLRHEWMEHEVFIVDAPFFNAFTIPGGNIYFTTGLLNSVENEHELAYIVGHELGHNENDHTIELAKLYKYMSARLENYPILGIIPALGLNFFSKSCGKGDEIECDVTSMYLLERVGYDPQQALGGVRILQELGGQRPVNRLKYEFDTFFRSHPWGEERVRCIEELIRKSKVEVYCEEKYERPVAALVTTSNSPLGLRSLPVKELNPDVRIPKGVEIELMCDCAQQSNRPTVDWYFIRYTVGEDSYVGWVDKKYVTQKREKRG